MTKVTKKSIHYIQCKSFCGALLAGTLNLANAGGLDLSNQNISPLFEKGSYAEFGVLSVKPNVRGTDVAFQKTGDILSSYATGSLAYKQDMNSQTSFAIILDEPAGVNLKYATAADGGSIMLGGTAAKVNTQELKGLVRYKFNDAFAIHGGLRIERTQGSVTLGGLGYGPLAGYQTNFAENTNSGYVVGGSFEIPNKALRVALTYNSAIKHEGDTKENIAVDTGITSVTTPQSVNLDMQTGVAANTLIFASIRWVEWSKYLVKPPVFSVVTNGASLTNISDSTTYTLGLAQKFNNSLTGIALLAYEPKSQDLISPLAGYRGKESFGLGVIYTHEKFKITTLASYSKLGNAQIATDGVARASFAGNKALAFMTRIGISF